MDSSRPLPPSPVSPPADPNRVLVVVTLDAERYTRVDLADVLDHGAVIRTRILNKLGVWGAEERTRALIFETEIGSLQIGQPLTDRSLSALCRERGDSKGSLAFIVDCGPPSAPLARPQTPPHPAASSSNTRRVKPLPTINDQTPAIRQRSDGFRSTPDRPIHPVDISPENITLGETQPRRVRPLPAIPTPAPTPSSGTPYSSSHDVNNDNHDLYDSAPRIEISRAPSQAQRQQRSRATNRSLGQLTIPSDRPQTTPSTGSPASPSTPIPFNWVRGELIGGNGVDSRVYMALNPVSGQIMALKQKEIPNFHPNSTRRSLADHAKRSFLEAVKSECELLQALHHKNIVKHFFFEETDTTVNILMEYVPGGTLRGMIRSFGPFPDNVTKFLTAQILDGLAYLHSNHILHRDLRAESILVQEDGVCKISDFSVSRFADKRGLVFTALQGSTFWMAPEVITTKIHGGGYTSKVDIWSLGCLVIEMWSNGRPWTGLDASKVMKRLSDALPPPLPDDLELSQTAKDFYDKCFIVDPRSRPSASDLRTHLYLNLPNDWIFNLLPASSSSRESGPDRTEHTIRTTPVVVVEEPPRQPCLHGFPRYSSSGLPPSEWLEKNITDLSEYIIQSKCDSQMREEYSSHVFTELANMQRLIIFSCEAIDDLTELRSAIHSWKSWDTWLTALIHYQEVNDRLLSFYGDIDQVNGLKNIVALDMDAICVCLHSIVTTEELSRQLLGLRGNEARSILDLLQMVGVHIKSDTLDESDIASESYLTYRL
ncbi:hypothetical protein C0993_000398 [Termitomyces sp. T159_Od127]|nr:hypothetical protein C0993_000398 [Termitomyces sp. T159_Od127]